MPLQTPIKMTEKLCLSHLYIPEANIYKKNSYTNYQLLSYIINYFVLLILFEGLVRGIHTLSIQYTSPRRNATLFFNEIATTGRKEQRGIQET